MEQNALQSLSTKLRQVCHGGCGMDVLHLDLLVVNCVPKNLCLNNEQHEDHMSDSSVEENTTR